MTARVHAHAFLDHAEPRVGSTVPAAPSEVRLWFSENLEPAFSTLKVVNASGQQVDEGDARVDPAKPNQLAISLKPLQPGDYTVRWRVVSVDTHATEGDFNFRVGR